MSKLGISLAWCFLAYLAALAAGAQALVLTPELGPIWGMAFADIVATLVVFGFSCGLRNASVYDPYWSVAPLAICGYWTFGAAGDALRTWAILALVGFWGFRLTGNWLRGWSGLSHEDWRYVDLRRKTGAFYPVVNCLGIHLFPTILVFLGCIPVYFLLQLAEPMSMAEGVLWLVGVAMVVLEWVADQQLWAFRRARTDASQFMQTGVWAWSRHPNYFGEAFFWVSLWGMCLVAGAGPWWAGAGALAMICLFVFVSIPMMQKKNLARKPGYQAYMARTSPWVPWPPKRD